MATEVSASMMCSLSAATEVTSLMVEHGVKPLCRASLWFTMVRMRPFDGSTTTTLPFTEPRASTAARRIMRSSPSTLSPSVGSTAGAQRALDLWTDDLRSDNLRSDALRNDHTRRGFRAEVTASAVFARIPPSSSGTRTDLFIECTSRRHRAEPGDGFHTLRETL